MGFAATVREVFSRLSCKWRDLMRGRETHVDRHPNRPHLGLKRWTIRFNRGSFSIWLKKKRMFSEGIKPWRVSGAEKGINE
ncbi:hypothetical protein TNCV_341661 [Trichonephila clavipes]|nr:hypothetical protein TNCV_341661 [Trichonephila clavipes]